MAPDCRCQAPGPIPTLPNRQPAARCAGRPTEGSRAGELLCQHPSCDISVAAKLLSLGTHILGVPSAQRGSPRSPLPFRALPQGPLSSQQHTPLLLSMDVRCAPSGSSSPTLVSVTGPAFCPRSYSLASACFLGWVCLRVTPSSLN